MMSLISFHNIGLCFTYFILFSLYFEANIKGVSATLSKSTKNKDTCTKNSKTEACSSSLSVFDRKLVTEAIKWKEISTEYKTYPKDTSLHTSTKIILAYVTPWNNHGYDIVKIFGGKFTHVSPVWLQLRRDQGKNIITGTHDIDQGWMKEVKEAGRKVNTKIVPRLIFEGWQQQDYEALINSKLETGNLIKEILHVLKKYNLDGLVMEVWSQLSSKSLLSQMPKVISDISLALRDDGYTFIMVIPPAVYQRNMPGIFSMDLFNTLVDDVDAFSLMTYDFSNFQNPGPNSPIWWMEDCVKRLVPDDQDENRSKILLGLNLYGLDHSTTGGNHVLGSQYIDIINKFKPKFKYDDHSAEHFFEYKSGTGRHTVFYPTLSSLNQRIKLSEKLNCGISMWEVGQGLDYFYDLL